MGFGDGFGEGFWGGMRGGGGVDLAWYGMAISSQSQTRADSVEFLQVRHRLLGRGARVPRGHGCEGTRVYSDVNSGNWDLQSPVLRGQQGDCAESGGAESNESRRRGSPGRNAVGDGERA